MRVTRFHWILLATALATGLIVWLCSGVLFWVALSVLFSISGTCIGLGVSFPQWQLFGESLCQVQTKQKLVALTFDDGPDPATTPALLDLLTQRNVRATFFCIGKRVARHAELAKQIVAKGHAIENHTHRHQRWTNLLSESELLDDLAQAQAAIQQATGRPPVWFRPPMGMTNPRVFRVTRKLGLRVAGYTARGLDLRGDGTEQIIERLRRGLQSGAILLLHDAGVPRTRLTDTVTALLNLIQAEGYRCVRLDELVLARERS